MASTTSTDGFTSQNFRAALGAFASGVTVITTSAEDHAYGMTANAFSSVSLDPPLVLICAKALSTGSEHIQTNGVFAVNILAAEQEPLSRYFSSKDRPRGRDALREIPHRTAVTGSPLLEGAVGYLDCRLHATHEAGDHLIFIGEVLALELDPDASPLLFHRGSYSLLRD